MFNAIYIQCCSGVWPFDELEQLGRSDNEFLQQLHHIEMTLSPDAPINIQFTSGTTGQPKAATLTAFGMINNACFVGNRVGYGDSSVVVYICYA